MPIIVTDERLTNPINSVILSADQREAEWIHDKVNHRTQFKSGSLRLYEALDDDCAM
jgi:hypothetical protein